MKPNLNNPARDYARSFARGFSQRSMKSCSTGYVLSFAPDFRPGPSRGGTGRVPVSLAPGFSRVELGRGNGKTVSTVFLKRAAQSEYK